LLCETIASPRGHLKDASSIGENDVGVQSGPITVTLPLNARAHSSRRRW
jgi:hypothetical protein